MSQQLVQERTKGCPRLWCSPMTLVPRAGTTRLITKQNVTVRVMKFNCSPADPRSPVADLRYSMNPCGSRVVSAGFGFRFCCFKQKGEGQGDVCHVRRRSGRRDHLGGAAPASRAPWRNALRKAPPGVYVSVCGCMQWKGRVIGPIEPIYPYAWSCGHSVHRPILSGRLFSPILCDFFWAPSRLGRPCSWHFLSEVVLTDRGLRSFPVGRCDPAFVGRFVDRPKRVIQ